MVLKHTKSFIAYIMTQEETARQPLWNELYAMTERPALTSTKVTCQRDLKGTCEIKSVMTLKFT